MSAKPSCTAFLVIRNLEDVSLTRMPMSRRASIVVLPNIGIPFATASRILSVISSRAPCGDLACEATFSVNVASGSSFLPIFLSMLDALSYIGPS